MTYFKTALIASAATALFATPAFAGDMMKSSTVTSQTTATYDAATPLTAEQRLTWETKIKANMSDKKKAKWATLTEAEQKMWMDKKIAKKMTAVSTDTSTIVDTSISYQDAEDMKRNDTIGEILQADGDADPERDRKLLMSNGDQMKKSTLIMKESDNNVANNAIVVPTLGTNVLTTVSCPVGTTAKPDMTCHVTGDYKPTS